MLDPLHSGNVPPKNFSHACPRHKILWGEDAVGVELFDFTPANYEWLLNFEFLRIFIEMSRALSDFDINIIGNGWSEKVNINENIFRVTALTSKCVDDEFALPDKYRWGCQRHENCHSICFSNYDCRHNNHYTPRINIDLDKRDGGAVGFGVT